MLGVYSRAAPHENIVVAWENIQTEVIMPGAHPQAARYRRYCSDRPR